MKSINLALIFLSFIFLSPLTIISQAYFGFRISIACFEDSNRDPISIRFDDRQAGTQDCHRARSSSKFWPDKQTFRDSMLRALIPIHEPHDNQLYFSKNFTTNPGNDQSSQPSNDRASTFTYPLRTPKYPASSIRPRNTLVPRFSRASPRRRTRNRIIDNVTALAAAAAAKLSGLARRNLRAQVHTFYTAG